MSDYLVVGGLVVIVAADGGAPREWDELGDVDRAFDGTLITSNKAEKRKWPIRTVPISAAAADALEAKLRSAPPLAVTGRMVGGAVVYCVAKLGRFDDETGADGEDLFVCNFTLLEV